MLLLEMGNNFCYWLICLKSASMDALGSSSTDSTPYTTHNNSKVERFVIVVCSEGDLRGKLNTST